MGIQRSTLGWPYPDSGEYVSDWPAHLANLVTAQDATARAAFTGTAAGSVAGGPAGTTDLNAIGPGTWYQGTAANATTELHYPAAGALGLIRCYGSASGDQWQLYQPFGTSPLTVAQARTRIGGTWSAWAAALQPSTPDTGWVTLATRSYVSGTIRVRRIGSEVTLQATAAVSPVTSFPSGSQIAILSTVLAAAYRPAMVARFAAAVSGFPGDLEIGTDGSVLLRQNSGGNRGGFGFVATYRID